MAPVQPVRANPAPAARDVSRAPLTRPVADRAPIQRPSEVKPAHGQTEASAARPQKTRFRPEPFYKPKEQGRAPAAAQTKNPAADPVKSPAPTPVNSAPKASAPNSPKSEAATKPVAAENSQQAKPTVNNVPKPEHAAPGTKPAPRSCRFRRVEVRNDGPCPVGAGWSPAPGRCSNQHQSCPNAVATSSCTSSSGFHNSTRRPSGRIGDGASHGEGYLGIGTSPSASSGSSSRARSDGTRPSHGHQEIGCCKGGI